jgi:hypothetical protein
MAWLVCVVLPLMTATFAISAPDWVVVPLAVMVPGSILVGVVRYRLLGIVLTRALVYATLTATVLALYVAVAAVAAVYLGRTVSPVPGAMVAALIAIALSPARARLQSAADRFVYGRLRDPVAAMIELGDRVATTDEGDLLPAVLDTGSRRRRCPTWPGTPAPGRRRWICAPATAAWRSQ